MSSVLYPTTNLAAVEQMVIDLADCVYIWDNQGNRYLEGLAGLRCTSLGYGNRELIDTATGLRN